MTLRRLLTIGFGFLAVLGVVVGAWAYWTTQGSGSSSASVGTLDGATISAPSISAGSITLSWLEQASLPSNPSLNSGITYTVERKLGSGGTYAALSGGGCSGSLPYDTASCTDSVDTSGDYYYRVTAHYHSSWTATSNEAGPVNADTVPPTIQSIDRHTSSPTNASSVQFDVTFSESVSGVDLADFALATTGVSGASKSVVNGSGASYTVTVDTGTGDGTVGLNLVDDDSIQDGAANKLGGTGTSGAGDGSFTGQVYTVDKSAPTIQSIDRHTSSPTNASSVQFDVTFSESVSGVDLADFALATTGVSGASKSVVNGSGASYTVTVDTGTGDGTVGLNLVDDDSIQDGAANKLGGTGTSGAGDGSFTGQVYTVDKSAPTIQSIDRHTSSPTNASSVQFDVTFSESVSGVDLADFALATTGVSGASKSVVNGSGASYTVTVDTGTGDGTVGLNLVDDDSIQDGAANKLGGTGTSGAGDGSFTGQVYTVDKSAPNVSLTRMNGSAVAFPYSTNAAGVTSIGGTCGSLSGDSTTVSVTINGSASAPPMATCSSGSWTLSLATPLSAEGSYTVAATQTDTAGNFGSSGNQTVTIDRTAPTRSALEFFDTNGNGKVDQVKVIYGETLGSYTAGTSPWTLANVPSGGSLASVSVSGSVATLNITEGGGARDTSVGSPAFTVAYTAPASGGIADPAGNKAASFAATSPSDKAAPALTLLQMFDANTNGKIDQVKATFSETLAASTATAPWTLTSVPSNGSISSVSVAGAVATLTLTEGAGAADTSVGSFTVALSASSTGIRDAAGNQSSFAAQAPADKAGPVPVSIIDTDGASNGLFQQNDTMTVTFSENVIGVAASSTVTLTGGSGSSNDSVSMTNLLAGTASLGRTDYMGASNKNAAFSASSLSQPAANQVRVTLASCSGDCSSIGSGAAGTGAFTFTPVSTIADAAGNAAAGSLAVTIRLF